MILHWKLLTSSLLLAFCAAGTIQAQEAEMGKQGKEEHIIIRKKGNGSEKLTIVVDGENVTVNGKPLAEFKDDSVEVKSFRTDRARVHMLRKTAPGLAAAPARPFPPMPPGGVKALRGNMMEHFKGLSNAAFLGVTSEKSDKGAVVREVVKESAAEKAGLQKGDVITRIGDSTVAGSEDLYRLVGAYKPEDKVKISYLRNGKEQQSTVTLGKNRQVFSLSFDDAFEGQLPREFRDFRVEGMPHAFNFSKQPRLGLQLQDTEDGKGVKVLEAREDAPATKAGIQKDDIITGVNGKDVHSVDDVREQLKGAQEGDTVKMEFRRNNKKQSAEVKFPKQLKTSNL